jgi:N-acylneuraminate cytidylyltransferase/CMP-N,N'-diacetyllegionaminic acid synthase
VGRRPLIAWTICAALESQQFESVIVSTEDAEIAAVARKWKASVPFLRPSELAGDNAGSLEVVEHVIASLDDPPEAIMLLQPTSPLRTAGDITDAIALLRSRNADAVVSVTPLMHSLKLVRRLSAQGELTAWRCSDADTTESLYQLNGAIYLVRTKSLLAERTMTPRATAAYVMPAERSIDIDTPWELRIADLALCANEPG